MSQLRSMRLAVVAAFVGAMACGPKTKSENLLERRVPTCESYCAALTDPACPLPTNDPNSPLYFESKDACVEGCANPEKPRGAAYWFFIDDGTQDGEDACYETGKSYYSCVGALSCEDRQTLSSGMPGTEGRPCGAEERAAIDCHAEQASKALGG